MKLTVKMLAEIRDEREEFSQTLRGELGFPETGGNRCLNVGLSKTQVFTGGHLNSSVSPRCRKRTRDIERVAHGYQVKELRVLLP